MADQCAKVTHTPTVARTPNDDKRHPVESNTLLQ